jgi:hypothetical protein
MEPWVLLQRIGLVIAGFLLAVYAPFYITVIWCAVATLFVSRFYEGVLILMVAEYVFRGDVFGLSGWFLALLGILVALLKEKWVVREYI